MRSKERSRGKSAFIIVDSKKLIPGGRIYATDVQGGPNITVNLYHICLDEHEPCAYADAVHICGSI